MNIRLLLIVSLFPSFPVMAWEDDAVLSFISRTNPIILAQKSVTQAYTKPDALTWALRNTTVSGRVGAGGTDFRDDPYTIYGGLQFNVPLSSIKEEREQALKQVAEARAIDDLHAKVMLDIASLRTLESELAASEVRRKFLKEKAGWLRKRIDEGYSSEIDELWTIGGKLNAEDATLAKVGMQAKTQRYKLARYAGEEWQTLLAYLEGRQELLVANGG